MKKRMKKMIALIAAVLLMMPQTAFAADQEVQEELVYPRLLEEAPEGEASAGRTLDEVSPESLQDETELYLELEGLLKEALMNGQQYIDLQEMQISQQEYSLYEILYFSPYFSNGINISFWYSGSYYTRAQIENSMTVEETRNYFSQVDQKVAAILSQVSDEMSDAEKMLAVHDYFVYEYAYDYDDYLAGTVPADSYRSGGLFINGVGVCQAYAYGYQYILCKLGLECYVTSSSGMDHAWNIVELDGEYYHVDCTWDDPVADRLGMVRHSYFLLSDETISDASVTGQAHYGWDLQTQLECTSKTYEDEYWNDAESKVFFEGDSAYYVRRRGVYQRDLSSGNEQLLADLGSWYVWDRPSYYVDAYSGLSVYNGDLYYNTRNELRRVSTDGEEDVLIYAPDTENGFVYGSKITGNELQYVIKQAPSEEGEILTAPVSLGTQEPDSIVLWDTRLEMTEGDTAALSYYLVPETAVTEVQWQSDNENVAAVDKSGTVTAVGEGTTTVTVTTVNGKEASCQVTVQAAEIPDPEPDPDPDPEVPAELPYQDVGKDAWYYGAVQYAYENGIMTGVNATTFAPGESLARAQFAVILHRMNGEPEVPYSARFHDVGEGLWYTDAILWAADTSVVTGYSNGNFGPGDNINREQMALMMYRYAAYKGYDTSVKADFSQYQDAGRVSDFAREAMQWAVGEQIITGKYNETQLDPQGNASRAECATIMMRFIEKYGM